MPCEPVQIGKLLADRRSNPDQLDEWLAVCRSNPGWIDETTLVWLSLHDTDLEITHVPATDVEETELISSTAEFPAFEDLLTENKIDTDALPHMGLAQLYNAYFLAKAHQVPGPMVKVWFRDVIAPAAKYDIETGLIEKKSLHIADVRYETFKYLAAPPLVRSRKVPIVSSASKGDGGGI